MAVVAERTTSQSPSRRISFGSKISALGVRLSRTVSGTSSLQDEERDKVGEALSKQDKDRSASRGREALVSSGRGGFGNIRQTSLSRDARPDSGPDDFSGTRGREPISQQKIYSTGRGGAGNLRSPSRETSRPPVGIDGKEQAIIDEYIASRDGAPISTGRGGIGNINRSRSRDPSTSRPVFSTGRGGAGNLYVGEGSIAEAIDEEERKKATSGQAEGGYHSTGRGGLANFTDRPLAPVEHPAPTSNPAPTFHSSGRGGAGNFRS